MIESPSYYYPETIEKFITMHHSRCQNLGLILDKYIPGKVIDDSKEKRDWFNGLVRQFQNFSATQKSDIRLLSKASYKRWMKLTKAREATCFELAVDWQLIIGLGGDTVLETDITLHHVYGYPIIPGSALKGLTRAFAEGEGKRITPISDDKTVSQPVAAEPDQAMGTDSAKAANATGAEKATNPDILRIFGNEGQAGTVIFFDAMPIDGEAELVVDIINPHYSEYYRSLEGKTITPPTNNQDPIPVNFLAVRNTIFAFALAPRDPGKHDQDVLHARAWLQEALTRYGIGGKTSAGYGYFREVKKPDAPSSNAQAEPVQVPYERPNIPRFNPGGIVPGSVIDSTDELKRIMPEAKAFLRFREFSPTMVLIVIEAEETLNWTRGNMKNCLFIREEEREGCTVLICQPGVAKEKKSKKEKKKK